MNVFDGETEESNTIDLNDDEDYSEGMKLK